MNYKSSGIDTVIYNRTYSTGMLSSFLVSVKPLSPNRGILKLLLLIDVLGELVVLVVMRAHSAFILCGKDECIKLVLVHFRVQKVCELAQPTSAAVS